MTVTMWIKFLLYLSIFQFQQVEAQSTVSGTESGRIILPCSLTGGSFTLPEWLGPPNDLIYTIRDDPSETINPAAPAASRLQFASNQRDLVMSNAQLNDSGVYKCSYSALGEHIVTLTVTAANCKCVCDCECRTIVIVSMVFGILGALGLLIIVVGIPLGCFNGRETLLLASGVIGIVFDVLSLVLSIVVTVKECCECCEENCEDSGCCAEDSECCKDWIDNAAIAFIVIPCVAIVASVVIFVLVKLDIIRPGNDGGNGFFCFNNGNDGGDDGGNDGGNNGHHRGHGTNSSTVHSERADTHRGTLSDRRPMPPIPLTDKKGRGLSANYDDEHPMISVGIPDKKAGDLGPLEEESKKKKKKKKKTKNDGDEREKEENKE